MKRTDLLPLLGVLFLTGCPLLQTSKPDADDTRRSMMIADTVPLANGGTDNRGVATPVPVEPSPFEIAAAGKPPHAMLSDLEPRRASRDDEPRAIPAEPIP